MSKKTGVFGIVGLLLAVFTLVFWDNIYQQIKGGPVFQNPPSPTTEEPAHEQDLATGLPIEITDSRYVPMRLVPAGDFKMGGDGNSYSMYLDTFYMDKYEVTNACYADCVTAGVCDLPHETKSDFRASYYGNPEYDNFPVMYVDWMMARTYCEAWRGSRLSTEADVVVVCLSKQFNQAGFCQKEVRLALDTAMEQPEGEIFIT